MVVDAGASLVAHDRSLTDGMLGRLSAAMAPLAAMNQAAGARSLFRDPRELVTHASAPEETPLEHACDSGVIHHAREVWLRWSTLPVDVRATLLWVAERSGAVVQAGAWSLSFGRSHGPPVDRAVVESSEEIVERSGRLRAKLQHDAKGGLTREAARALDQVTQREARARSALKRSDTRLQAWGEAQLSAAVWHWFGARHDAT